MERIAETLATFNEKNGPRRWLSPALPLAGDVLQLVRHPPLQNGMIYSRWDIIRVSFDTFR